MSGDRVWRMPLFQYYTELVKVSPLADLNNSTINTAPRKAGSCTAAAFLKVSLIQICLYSIGWEFERGPCVAHASV